MRVDEIGDGLRDVNRTVMIGKGSNLDESYTTFRGGGEEGWLGDGGEDILAIDASGRVNVRQIEMSEEGMVQVFG